MPYLTFRKKLSINPAYDAAAKVAFLFWHPTLQQTIL